MTEMTRVRHIATTFNGSRAVVAAFEQRVAVWDLAAGEKVAEFDTVLDLSALIPRASKGGESA